MFRSSLHLNAARASYGYFWEKDFFGASSAIRAFLSTRSVDGLTIWTFDSNHFIEMFVHYLHPLCNSFLLLSFVVLNANHNAAIVTAMNITEKIRIICQADVAAICFTPTRDLSVSSNHKLNMFFQIVSG
jgi:hypothetical protein